MAIPKQHFRKLMMRFHYYAVLVVALLLVILAVAWFWQFQASAGPASKTNHSLKFPQEKKAAVVVPGDFDWGSLSENDLNALLSHFGSTKSPNSFELSFVPSGETIIADVYEGMPGEFICTKLVPTVKKLDDGEEVVVFDVHCQGITLAGNVNTRFFGFENTRELKPGNSLSMVEITDDGQYVMLSGLI